MTTKTKQGLVNLDLNQRRWIDPDDVVHTGIFRPGNTFFSRCGIQAYSATDASLQLIPPTVTCIACVLYTKKKR